MGFPALPFTPDELRDLPGVISAPRFATYLQATGNDRQQALALYEWNLTLSAQFIVPLQVCEVAVRNGVAEAIEKVHGATWPWSNGFLRSLPRSKRSTDYNPEVDLRNTAARQPTTGKVVAELKFAFWKDLHRRTGWPDLVLALPRFLSWCSEWPRDPGCPCHCP